MADMDGFDAPEDVFGMADEVEVDPAPKESDPELMQMIDGGAADGPGPAAALNALSGSAVRGEAANNSPKASASAGSTESGAPMDQGGGSDDDDPMAEAVAAVGSDFHGEQDPENKVGDPGEAKADSPFRKWQAERRKVLQVRIEKARQEKEKILQRAEQALGKHLADREKKIAESKQRNVTEEKEKRADLTKVFQTGTAWQKVCRLLNLKPNPSRSVDRMRRLLVALKNETAADRKVDAQAAAARG